MSTLLRLVLAGAVVVALMAAGCSGPKALSEIERPARAAELDAYNVFVGAWDWEAKVTGGKGEKVGTAYTGKAQWSWTLDERCLHGALSAKSDSTEFESEGIWSWHPKKKKYMWWMFNNWGYPQEGTAKYAPDTRSWTMKYESIGLDGSPSYGRYEMKVIDNNTLEWAMAESADMMGMFPKIEMKGTYKRRR